MNERTKRHLRIAAWTLVGLLCVVFALVTGFFALMRREFGQSPPPAHYSPPANSAEANRQDLEYLRLLPSYDRSFSPAAKAAFSAYLDDATAKAGTLDRAGLEMAVAHAVALADNGHTNAQGVGEGRNLNALPIRMAQFADGFYIVMAKPPNLDLLGARVVSENGRSIDDLRHTLQPYEGGSEEHLREKLPNFLQSPQALQAAGLASSATEATFELMFSDGRQVTRSLTADPKPTPGYAWADRALSPARPDTLTQNESWLHLLDKQAHLPIYLQHVDAPYWNVYLEDIPALYVQINTMRDVGARPVEAYLSDLLRQIAGAHPRHMIVDFRFDSGGDYTLYADFSKKLPRLLPRDGKLFLITGPNTFSAAITTVARLKYFAGAKAVIVGETVGDRDGFWGEVNQFQLPNSRIAVQYATGYHDWVHGCTNWSTCFWLNFSLLLGVAAGPLTPSLPTPLSFSDYQAGIDPALKAIADQLKLPR